MATTLVSRQFMGARARGGQLGILKTASKQRGNKTITPSWRFSTTTAAPPTQQQNRFLYASYRNPNFALGVGGGLLLAGLHSATGSANDFYDYRFKSHKDPDDLASFYGGEELMVRAFCFFCNRIDMSLFCLFRYRLMFRLWASADCCFSF